VGPRAGMDAVEKRKILLLSGIDVAVQPVHRRYTDSAIPAKVCERVPKYWVPHQICADPACKNSTGIKSKALNSRVLWTTRPCNTGLGEEQAAEWKGDAPETGTMNACDSLSSLSLS
jgi:hypothetical protein